MLDVDLIIPNKLDYDNYHNIEELIKHAYSVFKEDLYNCKLIYNKKPIYFFNTPFVNGYEQGFFHICTTKSEMNNKRGFDVFRLERVNWIKPIIDLLSQENQYSDEILIWVNNKTLKTHIYTHSLRYLIVLEEKKFVYNFITAFYINNQPQHKKLMKAYYNSLSSYN